MSKGEKNVQNAEGEVIDVEKNPFKGIVISIKDKLSKIFYREENISCLRKCNG